MTLAGCNNRARPDPNATYMAQRGWLDLADSTGRAGRIPVMVEVKATFGAIDCQNYRSATEACCTGCCHRLPAGAPP